MRSIHAGICTLWRSHARHVYHWIASRRSREPPAPKCRRRHCRGSDPLLLSTRNISLASSPPARCGYHLRDIRHFRLYWCARVKSVPKCHGGSGDSPHAPSLPFPVETFVAGGFMLGRNDTTTHTKLCRNKSRRTFFNLPILRLQVSNHSSTRLTKGSWIFPARTHILLYTHTYPHTYITHRWLARFLPTKGNANSQGTPRSGRGRRPSTTLAIMYTSHPPGVKTAFKAGKRYRVQSTFPDGTEMVRPHDGASLFVQNSNDTLRILTITMGMCGWPLVHAHEMRCLGRCSTQASI